MTDYVLSRILQIVVAMLLYSFAIYYVVDSLIHQVWVIPPNQELNLPSTLWSHDLYIFKYLDWLIHILNGEFGYSHLFSSPLSSLIGNALLNTFYLLGSGIVLSVLIAFPLGVGCAIYENSVFDYFVSCIMYLLYSTPIVWLSLMLVMAFSIFVPLFPSSGSGEIQSLGWEKSLSYMVLPMVSVLLLNLATVFRYVRAGMLDVFKEQYVRAAKAKGASQVRVVFKHCVRSAMLPMVTVIAINIATVFNGAVLIETIFGWPGIGKLVVDAIHGREYHVALLCFMISTFVVLVVNLLADLLCFQLDPRIRIPRRF